MVQKVSRMDKDKFLMRSEPTSARPVAKVGGHSPKWDQITCRRSLRQIKIKPHETLPGLANLKQQFGSEKHCGLCGAVQVGLSHVLCGCNTALAQTLNRWRHDQVLRKLTELTESMRVLATEMLQSHQKHCVQFVTA